MHEQTFTQNILDQIPNLESVKEISLEVGELAGIDANHLIEHMKEKVDFDINAKTIPSKIECDCGYTGKAKIIQKLHDLVLYECPNCHKIPEAKEGKSIKITKVIYN